MSSSTLLPGVVVNWQYPTNHSLTITIHAHAPTSLYRHRLFQLEELPIAL
jgi:hypothetical protein